MCIHSSLHAKKIAITEFLLSLVHLFKEATCIDEALTFSHLALIN